MNYSRALFISFILIIACNSKDEAASFSLIDQIVHSDSFYLKEISQFIEYEDQKYFDTLYQVKYEGMCSKSNTSKLRISNSTYNCDDTFGILLDNLKVDTFLSMDIALLKVDYGFIDSAVYKKQLKRAAYAAKARGGDFIPSVSEIFSAQGINGLHYGFVDSTFANKMYVYYSASFVLDSIQLGIRCECYAIDCFDKLKGFQKIIRSMRLK